MASSMSPDPAITKRMLRVRFKTNAAASTKYSGPFCIVIRPRKVTTTAPEIYYAFAEATAFATKTILDHLAANGVAIERLTGIGGISQKSPFVMQLLADVTGREISVIDCKQACAMGSVVYATVIRAGMEVMPNRTVVKEMAPLQEGDMNLSNVVGTSK